MDTRFERKFEGQAGKVEWLTPKYITDALVVFDLDPCSPINRPWDTAKSHYTIEDDGLNKDWVGRVWCNPPYGTEAAAWLKKCAAHGNAMTLIFARTETKMFFDSIWQHADGLKFLKGRVHFYNVDGTKSGPAGAPSVIVAFGEENAEIFKISALKGHFLYNHKN